MANEVGCWFIHFLVYLGFIYGSTKTLRSTTKSLEKGGVGSVDDKITIRVQGAIQHLRLTAEEARIVVTVTNGEVFVYHAKDIAQQVMKHLECMRME